jgi:hypothetical protein
VDTPPDWRSFGGTSRVAYFAFPRNTKSGRLIYYCRADVVFVDVDDLSPMAEREWKS